MSRIPENVFLFNEPTEILYLPCLPLKLLQISCVGYICSLLIGVGKSLLGVSLEFMMIFAVFFPGRQPSSSDICAANIPV